MKTRGFEPPATKLLLGLSVWLFIFVMVYASHALGQTTADGGSGAVVRIQKLPPPPRPTEEGFEAKKIGSRYQPVPNSNYERLVFRLPGTQMTFAAYSYLTPKDDLPLSKYGFFFDDGRFFYVDEVAASDEDAKYALCDGYFIVDGSAHHASHNQSMYIFKYDKDSVKLVDMIGAAWDIGLDFVSGYPGKPAYGHELTWGSKDTPVWVIKDRDGRGHPLFRIKVFMEHFNAGIFQFYRDIAFMRAQGRRDAECNRPPSSLEPESYELFHLYFRIVAPPDGRPRLQVVLDPDLYKPLFDSVREAGRCDERLAEYYVYGFLSGQIDLSRIKAELPDDTASRQIFDVLSDVNNWDTAFHDRSGEPIPELIEYKLKRR